VCAGAQWSTSTANETLQPTRLWLTRRLKQQRQQQHLSPLQTIIGVGVGVAATLVADQDLALVKSVNLTMLSG
jgi:hypothetical protein